MINALIIYSSQRELNNKGASVRLELKTLIILDEISMKMMTDNWKSFN